MGLKVLCSHLMGIARKYLLHRPNEPNENDAAPEEMDQVSEFDTYAEELIQPMLQVFIDILDRDGQFSEQDTAT
jgi:hypothetical protein